jgi:LL-diaminopimelate aminotransferase
VRQSEGVPHLVGRRELHLTGVVGSAGVERIARRELDAEDACIEAFREVYLERRALLGRGLRDMGLRYTDARGGPYFWTDSSPTGLRAIELSYLLLQEARVLALPGTSFGKRWSDYLRITIFQPTEVLRDAVARMTPVVRRSAEAAARS